VKLLAGHCGRRRTQALARAVHATRARLAPRLRTGRARREAALARARYRAPRFPGPGESTAPHVRRGTPVAAVGRTASASRQGRSRARVHRRLAAANRGPLTPFRTADGVFPPVLEPASVRDFGRPHDVRAFGAFGRVRRGGPLPLGPAVEGRPAGKTTDPGGHHAPSRRGHGYTSALAGHAELARLASWRDRPSSTFQDGGCKAELGAGRRVGPIFRSAVTAGGPWIGFAAGVFFSGGHRAAGRDRPYSS